jgi:hypothetical protein
MGEHDNGVVLVYGATDEAGLFLLDEFLRKVIPFICLESRHCRDTRYRCNQGPKDSEDDGLLATHASRLVQNLCCPNFLFPPDPVNGKGSSAPALIAVVELCAILQRFSGLCSSFPVAGNRVSSTRCAGSVL